MGTGGEKRIPEPAAGVPQSVEAARDASAPSSLAAAEKGRRRHLHAMAVTMGFFVFYLGSIVTAPYFIAPGTVNFGEDGLSGRIDFEKERRAANMGGLVYALYWEGDLNHHQKASRSYFVNGNEMPQDTRDLGIYSGIIVALAWCARRMYRVKAWGLLLGLVPIGLDGGIQLFTDFVTINPFRVYTGFVCGLTVGFALASIYFDSLAPRDLQSAQREAARLDDETRAGGAALRAGARGRVLSLFEPLGRALWKRAGVERGDREFLALCVVSLAAVLLHVALFKLAGVRLYLAGW